MKKQKSSSAITNSPKPQLKRKKSVQNQIVSKNRNDLYPTTSQKARVDIESSETNSICSTDEKNSPVLRRAFSDGRKFGDISSYADTNNQIFPNIVNSTNISAKANWAKVGVESSETNSICSTDEKMSPVLRRAHSDMRKYSNVGTYAYPSNQIFPNTADSAIKFNEVITLGDITDASAPPPLLSARSYQSNRRYSRQSFKGSLNSPIVVKLDDNLSDHPTSKAPLLQLRIKSLNQLGNSSKTINDNTPTIDENKSTHPTTVLVPPENDARKINYFSTIKNVNRSSTLSVHWNLFKLYMHDNFDSQSIKLQDNELKNIYFDLYLNQNHLKKLRRRFFLADFNNSNNIDYYEFRTFLREQHTEFLEKLFNLIDDNDDGLLYFEDFARVILSYCSLTKAEILRFCFDMFDESKTDNLNKKQFSALCRCLQDINYVVTTTGNFDKIFTLYDENENNLMSFSEFCSFHAKFPFILYPLFRLQEKMQKRTFGKNQWRSIIKNYKFEKARLEYVNTHGGQEPPLSLSRRVGRFLFMALL